MSRLQRTSLCARTSSDSVSAPTNQRYRLPWLPRSSLARCTHPSARRCPPPPCSSGKLLPRDFFHYRRHSRFPRLCTACEHSHRPGDHWRHHSVLGQCHPLADRSSHPSPSSSGCGRRARLWQLTFSSSTPPTCGNGGRCCSTTTCAVGHPSRPGVGDRSKPGSHRAQRCRPTSQ